MKIRPEVMRFAEAMEKKLKKNDYKGGWKKMGHYELCARIYSELDELISEESNGGKKLEAVDIANFAMMIFDNLTEMKSLKQVITEACGLHDRCKVNLNVFAEQSGMKMNEVYRKLCEWNEKKEVNLSDENGVMFIKPNWSEK